MSFPIAWSYEDEIRSTSTRNARPTSGSNTSATTHSHQSSRGFSSARSSDASGSLPSSPFSPATPATGDFLKSPFSSTVSPPDANTVFKFGSDQQSKSQYFEQNFALRSPDGPKEQVESESIVSVEMKTNVVIEDEYLFLRAFSLFLAERYQRSPASIQIYIDHSAPMIMSDSFCPTYLIKVTALPSLLQPSMNKRNSYLIQQWISNRIYIAASRGVIKFEAIADTCYATQGQTYRSFAEILSAQVSKIFERPSFTQKQANRSKGSYFDRHIPSDELSTNPPGYESELQELGLLARPATPDSTPTGQVDLQATPKQMLKPSAFVKTPKARNSGPVSRPRLNPSPPPRFPPPPPPLENIGMPSKGIRRPSQPGFAERRANLTTIPTDPTKPRQKLPNLNIALPPPLSIDTSIAASPASAPLESIPTIPIASPNSERDLPIRGRASQPVSADGGANGRAPKRRRSLLGILRRRDKSTGPPTAINTPSDKLSPGSQASSERSFF